VKEGAQRAVRDLRDVLGARRPAVEATGVDQHAFVTQPRGDPGDASSAASRTPPLSCSQ